MQSKVKKVKNIVNSVDKEEKSMNKRASKFSTKCSCILKRQGRWYYNCQQETGIKTSVIKSLTCSEQFRQNGPNWKDERSTE